MSAKKRVENEFFELKGRIDKLDEFITKNELYKQLSVLQRSLLLVQSQAMFTYATILTERLENW